jgi:hypothetical protein
MAKRIVKVAAERRDPPGAAWHPSTALRGSVQILRRATRMSSEGRLADAAL